MRKFIERIAFYIRYEMTEEVKARIELGVLCGTLLIAFGVLGYGLYGLYRQDQQRAEQERASREEMRYFIELMGKPKPHPTIGCQGCCIGFIPRKAAFRSSRRKNPIGPMMLLIIPLSITPKIYSKKETAEPRPCNNQNKSRLLNAKSVQLIELHAFACDFVCLYLSESLHFLKYNIYLLQVIYKSMVQIWIILMSMH